MEIRGDVTDAGETTEQTSEDRTTQPSNGCWRLSFAKTFLFQDHRSILSISSI